MNVPNGTPHLDCSEQSYERRLTEGHQSIELHVILRPDKPAVVLHPPTFSLLTVGQRAGTILRDHESGLLAPEIAIRHGIPVESVRMLLGSVLAKVQSNSKPQASWLGSTPFLGKLVLNISHVCNLRCRYCYALGGSYGKKPSIMSPFTVRVALDRVAARASQIQAIQFFGGEPALNPTAIAVACKHLEHLYETKRLETLPALGIVTNGTVLTEELLELILRHKISVTVSLDGPPKVNDALRVSRKGGGTFSQVARNIRELQRQTQGRQPAKIEATYTKKHVDEGIFVSDLADFFTEEFGIRDVYIVPVSLPPNSSSYKELSLTGGSLPFAVADASSRIVASWTSDRPQLFGELFQYLHCLANRQPRPYLCEVPFGSITIDVNGNIYPCFMLMKEEFYMGNVSAADVFTSQIFKHVIRKFADNSKANISSCRRCWARNLCRCCLGVVYETTGTINQIPDAICDGIRSSAEQVLVLVSDAQRDGDRWQRLVTNALDYQNALRWNVLNPT